MSRRANALTPVIAEIEAGLPEGMTLGQRLGQFLVDELTGKTQDEADTKTEECREKCRNGNPFPLIAIQWPELTVADPVEQLLFRWLPQDRLALVTPQIREVVSDPTNPCLRLDWWQRVIIAGFFDPTIGEIAIKGCTGAGKGAAVGIGFSLWYDVYEESRITLTGRDYTHAVLNIFGEVKQWFVRMSRPLPASVLAHSINDNERHHVRILNPDPSSMTAGEAFSGAHGKNTIYGFDEATSSPDSFFENAEKNARKIISLANPRTLFGRFRKSFEPLGPNIDRIGITMGPLGNRLCVTVSGDDCANVRNGRLKAPMAPIGGIVIDGTQYAPGDRIPSRHFQLVKPLIPSQIDLQQFRAICSKGDKRLVDVFAYGKFPTEDPEKQVIMQSWLERHEKAWNPNDLPAVEAFGLDVAFSSDGDSTCLSAGGQNGIAKLHVWQEPDAMRTVQRVFDTAAEYKIDLRQQRHPVVIDADGAGKPVADRLVELGAWVVYYHGNARAEVVPMSYRNMRAEGYALLARRLNPVDLWRDKPWAMPADDQLRQELCAPEKIYEGNDNLRFLITPKNRNPDKEGVVSVKEKIGRSPDKGDSVVYLWHGLRMLHDFNKWMVHASAPLTVFPAPAPAEGQEKQNGEHQNGQNGHASPPAQQTPALPPAPEHPLLVHLREQYGKLVGRDVGSVPMPKVERAVEAEKEKTPAPAANGNGDSWLSRVKWGDD